jgi:hypothetical protein
MANIINLSLMRIASQNLKEEKQSLINRVPRINLTIQNNIKISVIYRVQKKIPAQTKDHLNHQVMIVDFNTKIIKAL